MNCNRRSIKLKRGMNWVSDESDCRSKKRATIKIIIFVNCLSFRQKII